MKLKTFDESSPTIRMCILTQLNKLRAEYWARSFQVSILSDLVCPTQKQKVPYSDKAACIFAIFITQ